MTRLKPIAPDLAPAVPDVLVVERPWGSFEQVATNESVTVKIIEVLPGRRLSLQSHEHRGELWQVLVGVLDVTVDGSFWKATSGQRIWVPLGAVHRMGNSGSEPCSVLEVAFGQFDEDDIRRLEDDFGRVPH